ncbi:phospholipid phosphatase 1-like isoform X1 [Schistocerca cancellata]|uniref:phospholipid phosphatase 1-like isoform X1 n=1 Tax=Schistocerca cancellata TaxID=274614 RepID=UPI0021192626|nr:phospholipid phosphatase 1-like isoform X1 [Schistocerca cancellata]
MRLQRVFTVSRPAEEAGSPYGSTDVLQGRCSSRRSLESAAAGDSARMAARRPAWKYMLDFSIFAVVAVLLALLESGVIPSAKTGYYCGDPKISFKFRGDTIGITTLLLGTFFLPLIFIWVVETLCVAFLNEYDVPKTKKQCCMQGLWEASRWYRDFLLGLGIVFLTTEVGKVLVGEPRPHFLDTCRPTQPPNCDGYVNNFTCTNKDVGNWYVRDSTKSFPSGHASLSVFASVFTMWFVQCRVPGDITYLLVPWLQCLCLTWALLCSLTRITDHRHHWWDVLGGFVLGFGLAVFTVKTSDQFSSSKKITTTYTKASKLDNVVRENGHISNNRHQSVRRLLSSTSSYSAALTPEERELREAALS